MDVLSTLYLMSGQSDMNAKLITEFIGTFFLCLTICVAGVFGLSGQNAPFAIAGTLMVMIYAGAHISGAHTTILQLPSRSGLGGHVRDQK